MHFDEATAALEREFGAQYNVKDRKADLTIAVISGGTVNTVIDPAPALCHSRELAVKLWLSAARAVLDGEPKLKSWAMSQPVVDTWNMTLSDARNTHRVTMKRYSASAVLTVLLKNQAEIDNEEAAAARRRDRTLTVGVPFDRDQLYEHEPVTVDVVLESVEEAEALQQMAEKL
jgi:hypothetical protein